MIIYLMRENFVIHYYLSMSSVLKLWPNSHLKTTI